MENEKPKPLFDLGICCVTRGAFAGLTKRHIRPAPFFNAHQCQQCFLEGTVIQVKAMFVSCFGSGPITSFFEVSVSIFDLYPVLEICVETTTDRKTTILKLKSEIIQRK